MSEELNLKAGPDFKDVEDGPLSPANRQCRDVICCLLFIANICGIIYCTIAAFTSGNPNNIYRATSGTGDICGATGTNTVNFPYAYFHNPTTLDTSKRVCVQTCPVYANGAVTPLTCKSGVNCNYDVTFDASGSPVGISSSALSGINFLGYDSQAFLGRICIPSTAVLNNGLAAATTYLSSAVSQGTLGNFVTDIQTNWYMILAGFGVAVIISFVFMFLLRCIAGILVWSSILAILAMLIAIGIIFLYNAGVISSEVDSIGSFGIPILTADNGYYAYFGYTAFGVAGVLLILLLCCCSRIRLAIAVCNCAGQFVSRVCQIMLVPIFQAILIALFWAFALVIMTYLISGATFVVNGTDVFTAITDYSQWTLLSFYYFVFATLWTNALLQAITTFVVASCCCMWYYTRGPGQDLNSPVSTSYWMVFRYHLGSLAFGSFILAVVQFLQFCV